MNRRRIAPVLAGVVLAMVGGLTCTDLSGPGTALTQVGLAPRFTRAAEDALRSLASFHLALDNIRVRLNRGDGSTAVDTVVVVAPGAESVSIELTVRVNGSEEQFNALIELRAGDLVLFSGTQVVVAKTTGSSSGAPIEVEYVGPGAGAVDVDVLPSEIAILSNQTAAFTAVAFDATEQQLPDLLVEWTVRDAALGSVSALGVFTPVAGARGSTWVIATLPTNVKDSARVTVSPVPTTAILVAGGGQVGAVTQVLSPFVFEVRAADQLPVPGVEVSFSISSGGGQLSATSATTGADGRVSTTLTLGTTPGENVVQLLVGDVVFATASATAGAGLPAALVLEGGSPVTVQAGQSIGAAHAVRVVDVVGNPVPNVQVALSLTPRGSPEVLLATTATSDQNGRVFLSALGATQVAGAFDIRAAIVEPAGIAPVVINVDVVAGGAALLVFTTQPPNVQAGAPFSVAVTMRDALGNVVTGFGGTVVISLGNNPSQGTLSGTLARDAVAGVATFDDLSVDRAASGYTLVATAPAGVEPVTSGVFDVAPAAAAALAFIAQPTTVGPGLPFSVGVGARDAFGNAVPTFAGSISLAIGNNPGGGTLGGTTTATATSGVATFSDLTISAAGTGYTLVASSGSLAGTSAAVDVVDGFRVTWISATGGAWSNGANWDRGTPPTAGDTAVVDLNGTYTIALDQSASVASLFFGGTTGQQRLQVAANTLTVSTLGVFTTNSVLELSGGSIDGAGGILLNGQFFWTGGTLTGTGSLQTAAGSLTEINGATKTLTQRFVGIGGNGTWQGGDIFAGGSAQLHVLAGGSLTVAATVGFLNNQSGIAAFVNGGTLTTAGTVTVSGTFSNAGALSVDSGALILSGGGSWVPTSTSIADGAAIHFPSGSHALGGDVALAGGEILVNGGTVAVVGTYSSTGLTRITSGTISFDPTAPATLGQLVVTGGTLNGGGTVTVANQFTWSGGTLAGSGTTAVDAAATTTLDGATKTLLQRTLSIAGSATWSSGDVFTGGGAHLDVLASGSLNTSGTVAFNNNQSGVATFANAGTLTTGGGTMGISGTFNNSGTVMVQSGVLQLGGGGAWTGTQSLTIATGAILNFSNDAHTLGGAISGAGSGELRFTGALVTLNGTIDGISVARVTAGTAAFDVTQPTSVGQLIVQGGTLSGSGSVIVTTQFTWDGGAMTGSGVTEVSSGASAALGGATKTLLARTVRFGGTVSWTAGDIFTGGGANLVVLPTGTLNASGTISFANNQSGIATLSNQGTVTTAGFLNVTGVFNNSGSLSISGMLALGGGGMWSGTTPVTVGTGAALTFSGGTHALGSAVTVTGSGEVVTSNSVNVAVTGTYSAGITSVVEGIMSFDPTQPATTSQLIVNSGTVSGGGVLLVQTNFEWLGGALTGAGETQIAQGAAVKFDGSTKTLIQRTLTLGASATWTAGDIFTGGGATFRILSTGTLTVPGTVGFLNNQSGAAVLVNEGSLETSGAVTITSAFDNAGGLLVNAGTLKLQGGGTWSGDRNVGVGPGAVADLTSGTFVVERNLTSMGTQSGTGILRFGGADFQINGSYQIIGATEVTAGRVTIAQNFDVNGMLTHSGGLIDVKGNVTFAGAMQALGGGQLDIGGNFSHTGNGDNQRMIANVAHVTRFIGDATSGRVLQWDVLDPVSLPSSFGQLEIATTGAEGIALASNQAQARLYAEHLLVRSGGLLRVPLQSPPRFTFEFGGTIGFGLVIETGGTFDNSANAAITVVNNDPLCVSLFGLLRGPLSCLTVQ